MKPYVMFGTHPLFGDYADAVHALGGFISRVVCNADEPPRPPGQRLEDRLAGYHAWLERNRIQHHVEIVPLEEFSPRAGEEYLFGFRGPKLLPLRDLLERMFGLNFSPVIHPAAHVSPMADVREGAFIGARAVIAPHARIGEFTLVNRAATIGHGCDVGPCVIIGPSAAVASGVRLESGAVVGIGATVIENLVLGQGSYVAAGAVVLKDVPPRMLVAGVPATAKKPVTRT